MTQTPEWDGSVGGVFVDYLCAICRAPVARKDDGTWEHRDPDASHLPERRAV